MNSLAHFQYEARVSLQKCYLPATLSTMNNRRHDIPYFLRSFARKAKTDPTVEQPIVSQNPDDIISTPSSVPPLSYTATHSYTRRNKYAINSEEHRQHQYALRKRVKEDSYKLLETPTFQKHISSLYPTKEQKEVGVDLVASSQSVPEEKVDEMAGSSENQIAQKEEEQKRYKAVMICNTVEKLRQWYYSDYGRRHQNSSPHGLKFTITSYNILAQELLEDNNWLYRHVEPDVLQWDYRCRNLIRELCSLHSDIVCLQEVQADHFETIFKPNFEALGYECLYKKRTGQKSDGCAVFFRKSMFSLVKCQAVEFNKPGIPLLDRDNVGLIVLLRPRGLPSTYDTHLCVATTHLLFNPRRGDVKLAQLRLLLAELDKLAFKKYCKTEKLVKYHPVILCGDMNSEPFSPLYDFLCKGYLNCDSLLSGDISGQMEGANRGRILDIEDLLHPDVAINEYSQFAELQKSRQEQESNCFSNDRKGTDWSEILTIGQSTQWPFDSSESSPLCDTKTSHCSESSLQPMYSSAPAESSYSSSTPAESFSLPVESSSSPVQPFSPSTTTICHYFNFSSAYTHFCGGKHEVTTHHSKANCTVDYIFYSAQSKNQYLNNSTTQDTQLEEEGPLHHLASYRLLNDSEMSALGGLPNSYQSSDHLSLASKFLLKFS